MAEIQPHSPGLARVRISMRPETSFPSLSSIEPSLSSGCLFRTWTDSIQKAHTSTTHSLRRKGVCPNKQIGNCSDQRHIASETTMELVELSAWVDILRNWNPRICIIVFIKSSIIFIFNTVLLLYFLYSSVSLKCKWISFLKHFLNCIISLEYYYSLKLIEIRDWIILKISFSTSSIYLSWTIMPNNYCPNLASLHQPPK